MARDNGGIIGPANNPTSDSASGVWDLPAQYQAISGGNWPPIPTIAANSLRFNGGSSDYLNITPASASNRETFTFSFWVKRSRLGYEQYLYCTSPSDAQTQIIFSGGDVFGFDHYTTGYDTSVRSTQVFRDPSAWYHFVVAVDTTQATASNRVKLYVNGSQITDLSASTYPAQDYQYSVNNTVVQNIGRWIPGPDNYYSGYFSEYCLIDGQALDPTSFGQFNANGIWTPIPIGISSFGTNGFHLRFENSASLGLDSSPNGNNFTVNNLTSIDQTTDIPTNNFCTLNPLAVNPSSGASTLSNGNTSVNNAGSSRCFGSTLAVSKGKYYWEYKMIDLGDMAGARSIDEVASGASLFSTSKSFGVYYGGDSQLYINGSSQGNIGTSTDTANDIAMFALDCDNNEIYLGLNGNWTTGIGNGYDTATFASANGFTIDSNILWTVDMTNGSSVTAHNGAFNFGNPPFTIASGNSDANGYGTFEYAVPSGYYALNTKNLAEFG